MQELPMAKEKCACCGANLDRFVQPVILAILAKGSCTGYAVVKQMTGYVTFADGGPDPTGVYRYLKIMKGRGLIEQTAEGLDDAGATPLYAITPEGVDCLKNWVQTLEDYAAQLTQLAREIKPDSL